MRELKIENNIINDDSECFIIAEVGHNHQGSVETAKQIFDKAKEVLGSNIVQFGFCQSFDEYAKWLWKADILPVTSNQDFLESVLLRPFIVKLTLFYLKN